MMTMTSPELQDNASAGPVLQANGLDGADVPRTVRHGPIPRSVSDRDHTTRLFFSLGFVTG